MKLLLVAVLFVTVSARFHVEVKSEAFQLALKEAKRIETVISSKNSKQVAKLLSPNFSYRGCSGRVSKRRVLSFLRNLRDGLHYNTDVISARLENGRRNLHMTVSWQVGKFSAVYDFVLEKRNGVSVILRGKAADCKIRGYNRSVAHLLSIN